MANYYNPYQNYYNNPYNNMQYQQPIQQPTIQQGGYINVSSEQEAINYPIAPNTSLVFIDWANKKVYEKIKGISPSDVPMMKKYNLNDITEGETTAEKEESTNSIEYAEKSEIKALRGEIERIKNKIQKLSEVNADE